jgi:sulfate/thiosulfate transport system substrate-binding protein
VFLVRKGNPKAIRDWEDLVKPGVQSIIPNPKTSGNGRYSYLAAWAYASRKYGGEAEAFDFVRRLFKSVPVLDSGGRGATTTFVQRGIGDVLLTFENEVYLIARELNPDDFEVVTPSISIEAEAPVAVVEKVASRHGTLDLARAYLQYQWSEEGQQIAARHYLRPRAEAAAKASSAQFPALEQLSIEAIAGDWASAQKKHFADGGLFDKIFQN